MVRLKLSTYIAAPVKDVYEHVTFYGPSGPTDNEAFTRHYGKVSERTGDKYLIIEDVNKYPEDPPDLISWRCTFVYPNYRTMENLDSTWADRRDDFMPEAEGTRWNVEWNVPGNWLRGILRMFGFKTWAHKRIRQKILDPVKDYFENGEDKPAFKSDDK